MIGTTQPVKRRRLDHLPLSKRLNLKSSVCLESLDNDVIQNVFTFLISLHAPSRVSRIFYEQLVPEFINTAL
jgi:hypothetical protein